ncbi:unnamed protein product [Rotaria sp. Silwood1]|nr:unnamed protein product [Rotaria sp. Silwood1]
MILAYAMEHVHLHRRLAFRVLSIVGSSTKWSMAGLMGVTAFLSMWINNSAATSIMIPAAIAIIDELENYQKQIQQQQQTPVALDFKSTVIEEKAEQSSSQDNVDINPNELMIDYVTDGTTALLIGSLPLILPDQNPFQKNWKYNPILQWDQLSKSFPWGVFMLQGAGLAIADGFQASNLSTTIVGLLQFIVRAPKELIILVVIIISAIFTEFTSNIACASILFPILDSISRTVQIHPAYLIMPSCMAVSLSFMLPIATPPNTMIFSSGHVRIMDLIKAGIGLKIIDFNIAITMNKTTLESLSNEVFLNLFELFNAIDLFRTFHSLNTRFNTLLFVYFRNYRVDFRSILKEDYNIFCPTYFSSIVNRTIYLRLSDDEDTPYQCTHFLSAGLTLDRFDNLRSLTFYCVSSDQKINQSLFFNLYRLHHLTHLKFVDCRLFHINIQGFQNFINQIWNLPKLTHLYWDCSFKADDHFRLPTVVSTSLQYLTICNVELYSYQFINFLKRTPQLQKFSTSLTTDEEDDLPLVRKFIPSPKNLSIKKLVLSEVSSQRLMTNLFQLVPNVNHLKVEIFSLKIDGHQWEQIIINYLPKLNILQFMMSLTLGRSIDDQMDEEKVDQYLATYRTSFWIERCQWFIRCHWRRCRGIVWIRLYSLPYAFYYFPIFYNELDSKTKSTCPGEMYFSYDSVRNVAYKPPIFNNEALYHVHLFNVEVLTLEVPIDQRFLSIVLKFENLHSLNVTISTIIYRQQLQALFDNAPRLYSLSFESWNTSTTPPYQYTSATIHRLNLQGSDQSGVKHRYTRKQCLELSRSPLGIQCRVLLIAIEEPQCILDLIDSMINLRTLRVSYEYDKRSNKYDLIQVLQASLPSTWTVIRFCYGLLIIQS